MVIQLHVAACLLYTSQGKASAHGEPLGVDNIKAMRENLGWKYEEPFFVPEEVYEHYSRLAEEKADTEAEWNAMFAAYCDEYPEMEKLWEQYHTAPDAKALIENEALWLCLLYTSHVHEKRRVKEQGRVLRFL